MGHPARTSCQWGVSYWKGGKWRKRFPLTGTVITANPRKTFVGELAYCVWASQAARRRRDGEDNSTKGRWCFVCRARMQNRWSDTGRDRLPDRTEPVTPSLSARGSPLAELDPHLDLSLPEQKSLTRARRTKFRRTRFRGAKSSCNQPQQCLLRI